MAWHFDKGGGIDIIETHNLYWKIKNPLKERQNLHKNQRARSKYMHTKVQQNSKETINK